MKTIQKDWRILLVLCAALVLFVPSANAASILIDAGNIEELVTFTFSQFEGGFSINGSTPTSGGSFTFGEGTQLNFTGQWLDLGQSSAFSRTVYWVDPEDGPNVISEIFQYTITPSGAGGLATISGFFQAEGLGTIPPGVGPGDIITEMMDGSHDPFQFTAAFLTGQIITGAGGGTPQQVPEPSTLLLLGAALIGMGGLRKRFKE